MNSPRGPSNGDAFLPRTDWTRAEIAALFDRPFADLLFEAQTVHRAHHASNTVQRSQLLSIKTGGCAQDCGYCSQSAQFDTGLRATKLMDVDAVLAEAARARAGGATRFCMGAAWTGPKDRDLPALTAMVAGVKALGLETCMTLGTLAPHQADALGAAGLDYYNHNLDSSPEYYAGVVSTRSYGDRLDTLAEVRRAGMATCCGGIIGMGESRADRIGLIHTLATLARTPRLGPDQRAGAGGWHPTWRCGPIRCGPRNRRHRVRAHHRRRAHYHAARGGAPVRRARGDEHGSAGARVLGGRELDLRRRPAADHRQSGAGPGRGHVRDAGVGRRLKRKTFAGRAAKARR